MPGLLDLIAARNPEQARGLLSDLMAGPKLRLSGLLADPVGFANETLQEGLFGSPETRAARDKFWNKESMTEQENQAYTNQLLNLGLAGLTVYHGSPHKFDKFDMSKIGTGEGAQAYGHGLYFAESPGVAKQYADTLSSYHIATKDGVKGGGDFADALVANAGEYPSSLSSAIRSQANKIATDLANGKPAEQIVSAMRNGPYARIYSGLADAVENLSPSKAVGSLYKTDIPDEAVARFLDWDKKLSEQAPEVRDALLKQLPKDNVTVAYENPYNIQKGNFWKVYRGDNFIDAKPTEDAAREYAATIMNDAMTGGSAYGRIGGAFSGLGSHSAASDYLKQQGIPGIRYLDGGSRNAGQGTYNYVVFDDALPTILERNGQALK